MLDNPLLASILTLLKRTPKGLSEYDLICQLLDDGIRLRVDGKAYELMLFQKHFLVMNALYRLQIQLLEDQEIYLSISPLLIKLEPMVHRCNTELLADYGDAKLSEYYLDWNNFDQSLTDVKTLLDDFWKRYFAGEQREDALKTLDLGDDADWQGMQQAYRRLAAKHHPDKGGDQAEFVAIKKAYDVLSFCYKRC